ncbi:hypothetical protein SGUI_1264 [Serinicoccus hydrothermalis]|uniref:Uncharacterized protein n=1 Tax=Serinicoccus hydrothermalis TaxID=1758689 RepID=A0A1B1NB50_9MICO|nr:hypothetical protein SGUI_1264 [Serinicoccus hydrothermalis]
MGFLPPSVCTGSGSEVSRCTRSGTTVGLARGRPGAGGLKDQDTSLMVEGPCV